MPSRINSHQLLDNEAAAEFLDVDPTTLTTWRCRGPYTIPYIKIGANVRYDVDDLVDWLESRKVGKIETAR